MINKSGSVAPINPICRIYLILLLLSFKFHIWRKSLSINQLNFKATKKLWFITINFIVLKWNNNYYDDNHKETGKLINDKLTFFANINVNLFVFIWNFLSKNGFKVTIIFFVCKINIFSLLETIMKNKVCSDYKLYNSSCVSCEVERRMFKKDKPCNATALRDY